MPTKPFNTALWIKFPTASAELPLSYSLILLHLKGGKQPTRPLINVNSRLTYKGPLALYLSYFVLLVLGVSLALLSFRLDSGSILFLQLLATGLGAALIAIALILHSTQIIRNIDPARWHRNAGRYYNDEGVFEYMPNGFAVMASDGSNLRIRWQDIVKADSGERKVSSHLRILFISLHLPGHQCVTVDSTMPGFCLFEKKLKENLSHRLSADKTPTETALL